MAFVGSVGGVGAPARGSFVCGRANGCAVSDARSSGAALCGARAQRVRARHAVADVTMVSMKAKNAARAFRTIETKEQLDAVISTGKLVVVKFGSPSCRSCKFLEKECPFISREFSQDTVDFVQLNLKESRDLFKELGIKTMPTVHLYRLDKGLLEEMAVAPNQISKLKELIALHEPLADQLARP
ncbi:Thioredoxin-like 2, chloroplastic [Porphyridium purpureum]|uniref:Thioredoxin-like 2, chloroplastic n=1 Tax=Porphyridium purpureum TaxID=35688 RepID=A0A5J4Z6D7_PORPP|nr:Thioredoxin-like 2, chloroplastic [Porphyridium purpureum]|eukprot:POR1437..scf295_1